MQITIKPLGLQALVELFRSNAFITHRAQDGGNCIFVMDAGLETDSVAQDRHSPWKTPPKLDVVAAKNFIEAIEKIPPLETDII